MSPEEIEEYENMEGELQDFEGSEEIFERGEGDDQRYFEDFDDSLSDIDFSEIRGDFKKSFSKVNHKIKQKQGQKKTKKFITGEHRRKKPLTKEFGVKRKAFIESSNEKKISRVLIPRDRKVIVEGVNKFILSADPKDDSIRNIGYYKGKKLDELVFTFNNDSALDFNLELFNPSMPLDYLQSTSLNLNDKIMVAGGEVSYTDVLFNLLANPALLVNAKFVFAGPLLKPQINQTILVKNKRITGEEKIAPITLPLHIDTMQVAQDIVFFDIMDKLNRPFIPDGMDVMQYKVLAGMTVTMAFFYKQVSLKKVFYEEARKNKEIM